MQTETGQLIGWPAAKYMAAGQSRESVSLHVCIARKPNKLIDRDNCFSIFWLKMLETEGIKE
jgi:hypothetical protein